MLIERVDAYTVVFQLYNGNIPLPDKVMDVQRDDDQET